ncbi:MAG: putative porin [Acidobacteriia bacterium]|nr:putative porin [Terriglobia bacterium]
MKTLVWFHVVVLAAAFAAGQTSSKPKAAAQKVTKTGGPSEIQQLRDALTAQQEQMEQQRQQMEQLKSQLQQLLDATQQANAAAQKGQSSADQAQSTAAQAQQSAAEAQRLADQASANAVEAKTALSLVNNKSQDEAKKISALSDALGRFRFSGDVRLRGESIFQGASGLADRNRARIRARFGFESKLNEDFSAGVFIATGSLGDLTSANESLTNFFNRKTIGLDRAFITYQPVAHNWLQVTGGKFAYTWSRTSLTFDPDINPEGFSEKLSWNMNEGILKNFSLGGVQLLYSEMSAGTDSYSLGAHASAKLQYGPWTATPQFFAMKWNNPSAILQASAFAAQATKATDSGGKTIFLPGEGPGCASGSAGSTKLPSSAPCALASNGMTNAVYTDPATGLPKFLSGFFYTDYILNNEIKTGREDLPLNVLLEFQQNLDAASHPLDTNGKVIPDLGSQGKGYMVDVSLGQTKNKNDLQFGYGFWRQEQDAILATFSESEQRASTNIVEHRIYALWKLRSNTIASFNWWRGRTLNTGLENNAALIQGAIKTAGQEEPYLNRYQFDLIYSF